MTLRLDRVRNVNWLPVTIGEVPHQRDRDAHGQAESHRLTVDIEGLYDSAVQTSGDRDRDGNSSPPTRARTSDNTAWGTRGVRSVVDHTTLSY